MVLFERAMMELSSLTASVTLGSISWDFRKDTEIAYINEFGFFFFLRIAVAVSSFCGGSVIATAKRHLVMLTSLASAPDGSLGTC